MINLLALTYTEYSIMVLNSMVLCFVFLLALFFCHARHWMNKLRNNLFFVYLFTFFTLFGEITWMIIDGNKNLIWLNYIANMFSLGGCLFIGYFWLMYCFESFPGTIFKKTWFRLIFFIPVIVDEILILLSPLIGKMFYIDAEGVYHRGPLFILQSIGYIYIITGAVFGLNSLKKVYLSVEKTHLRILVFAALPTLIIGGVQFFLPAGGLPYFQFSMFISLFGVFVHDEERKITVDPLTKLKTRYEFERILNDKIKRIKIGIDKNLFVIAGDINSFKTINDNYGHNEGDKVICNIGDIMDHVSSNYHAIACRRSGDEFLIVAEGADQSVAENIINEIDDELKSFYANKEYDINLSYGIAQYDGKENLRELVNKADALMYIQKRKLKNSGN